MATLAVPIHDAEEAFNPNAVKVVMDAKGYALYFSRATIPWDRDRFAQSRETIGDSLLRHIGIYGYRAGFIRRYVSWAPSPLEQIEMLSSSCECCGMARKSMSPWRPKCPAPAWIPRKIWSASALSCVSPLSPPCWRISPSVFCFLPLFDLIR